MGGRGKSKQTDDRLRNTKQDEQDEKTNTVNEANASSSSDDTTSPKADHLLTISVTELRHIINSEMNRVIATFKTELAERIDLIDDAISKLTDVIVPGLSKEIKESLQSIINSPRNESNNSTTTTKCDSTATPPTNDSLCSIAEELQERERKKNNLIIFNLPEATEGSINDRIEADNKKLTEMRGLMDLEKRPTEPIKLVRLGRTSNKPRPLVVSFSSSDIGVKYNMLGNAKNLRNSIYSKVSIRPDLTKMQQINSKSLREELLRRRDAGEDVVIRKGIIVSKN